MYMYGKLKAQLGWQVDLPRMQWLAPSFLVSLIVMAQHCLQQLTYSVHVNKRHRPLSIVMQDQSKRKLLLILQVKIVQVNKYNLQQKTLQGFITISSYYMYSRLQQFTVYRLLTYFVTQRTMNVFVSSFYFLQESHSK